MRALAIVLCCASLGAQALVKDINPTLATTNPVSLPDQFVVSGSLLYFTADDGRNGRELWCTDGTTAGTRLVKDIAPGPTSSGPVGLADFHGVLLFFANENSGAGLWRSDGTANGTRLLFRVKPFFFDQAPPLVIKDRAYFMATDPDAGTELHVTDGTPDGTHITAEVMPGAIITRFSTVMSFRGECFFLWGGSILARSDGTAAGTSVVKSMPQVFGTIALSWAVVGDWLYFPGNDLVTGRELWRTDGTAAGTQLVFDATPNPFVSDIHAITALGGRAVFASSGHSPALWSTDGTSSGTQQLDAWITIENNDRIVVGDKLYFRSLQAAGQPLMVTDGTKGGTHALGADCFSPSGFCVMRGTLYFRAWNAKTGSELWRSDGTDAGTWMVRELEPEWRSGLAPFAEIVLFQSRVWFSGSFELWSSDGTSAGTALVADIAKPLPLGSSPRALTAVGDQLFFLANDGFHGAEVWVSDGTSAGTRLLLDASPGASSSDPNELLAWRDRLVFTTFDYVRGGATLWLSDGSAAGTRAIVDPLAPHAPGSPRAITILRDRLLFLAADKVGTTWLWSSDGTATGTKPLASFAGLAVVNGPIVAGPRAYVITVDEVKARSQCWVSDGTSAGTVRLLEAPPPFWISRPRAVGAELYFHVWQNLVAQDQLWKTDGTLAGTKYVTGMPGTLSSTGFTFAVGDRLYFLAQAPLGVALCVTRGDLASTVRLREFRWRSNGDFAAITSLTPDVGLFAADDGAHGLELWRTDGTPNGTQLVKDLQPGMSSALDRTTAPAASVAKNARALFSALVDGGCELFATDGTTERTGRIADVFPGAGSSFPREFTRVGDTVFFSADDGVHGRELWKLSLKALGGAVTDPLSGGCSLSNGTVPRVSGVGVPVLGNLAFAAQLTSGSANATLVWIANVTRSDLRVGPCTLRVAVPSLVFPSRTDAVGVANLALPIPGLPALLGLDVYLQAALAEPTSTFALSDALRVLIGS